MESTITKLRCHIDSIIQYLTPLLPLANCHMVEFITQCHWERYIPKKLRESLEKQELSDAMEKFWKSVQDPNGSGDIELDQWVKAARSHTVTANNVYCIPADELQTRITAWGGRILPEIQIKEFMTSKKSYEVGVMSRLVASLASACGASCCVEAGGGRGSLLAALSIAYGLPALTVDCDPQLLVAAEHRTAVIQKQWHVIAKKLKNCVDEPMTQNTKGTLHRFARSFVTRRTDLPALVRETFPELPHEVTLLLTGLHTCGNLGPDSLRIFLSQPSIAGVFNVPCCYHHLSEETDVCVDVFRKNYGTGSESLPGFPMSDHLKGYNIGRNARMLAAQSIDRVVSLRQLPSKSLLYRALLEVLIKKHRAERTLSEGKLKRIASKCEDFKQYFKMADSILKLELYDNLPEGYINDICSNMADQWKKLVLFYLLRLCLAQVVETVILLDRLLFMFENGCENVYLVKLFDAVLSPRCHSIVAVR